MSESKFKKFSRIKQKEYFEIISKPHFLELDGLVILESHYNPENFEITRKRLKSRNSPVDLLKAENTINHVHLDAFTKNVPLQMEIGEYLRKIWIDVLRAQFSTYDFECKVEHYEEGWELVLWKKR